MQATIAIIAQTENGQRIAGAGVILSVRQDGFTNSDGYAAFQVEHGALTFSVHKAGYKDYVETVTVTKNRDYPVVMVAITPALHLEGTRLRNANGEDVFLKGATFFPAFHAWLTKTRDLRPALDQLATYGCNMIRVFGMWFNVQPGATPPLVPIDPTKHPNYYDEIVPFCHWIASDYGMYVYWSALPDNGILMPNQADKTRHYDRTKAELEKVPSALLELSNERFTHGTLNAVDVTKFARPTKILGCSGSYDVGHPSYSGKNPAATKQLIGEQWDFGDLHPSRSESARIKDCNPFDNPIYKAGKGMMIGEPNGVGPTYKGVPYDAKLMARASMVGGMGNVIHSVNGKRAEPFDAATKPFADEWFSAFRGV